MKKFVYCLVGLLPCLWINQGWAQPRTVVIQEEQLNTKLDIKYPQGFANAAIDEAVQTFIKESREEQAQVDAQDPPTNKPLEKNSLRIDYQIPFQNQHALSLLFTISSYYPGAAHPSRAIKTFNFIQGEAVTLDQLFVPNSNYLRELAVICRDVLTKKLMANRDWIIKGTLTTPDNYKHWYFTTNGLAIVFESTQVAAAVYGPQEVIIPKQNLVNWLRPELVKLLWDHE